VALGDEVCPVPQWYEDSAAPSIMRPLQVGPYWAQSRSLTKGPPETAGFALKRMSDRR